MLSLLQELVEAYRSGRVLDLNGRLVPADLVRQLVLGRLVGSDSPDPRGLRIRAAKIIGRLDLSCTEIRTPVIFEGCFLESGLDFSNSRTKASIRILDCHSLGSIDFTSAEVGSNIKISASVIDTGGQAAAVLADGAVIRGAFFMDQGCQTTSGIRMIACTVGENLVLTGSNIGSAKTHWSVLADGLRVDRAMLVNNGFRASGPIILSSSTMGDLDFSQSSIQNEESDPFSIMAQGVRIAGNFMAKNLVTRSHLILDTAEVSGSTSLAGAQIGGKNGSLTAQQSEFGASLDLAGIVVSGLVNLDSATVNGSLDLSAAYIKGEGLSLNCENLEVGRGFGAGCLSTAGMVRLINCSVGGQIDFAQSSVGCDSGSTISIMAARLRAKAGASLESAFLQGGLVLAGAQFDSQLNMKWLRVEGASISEQAVGYSVYAQAVKVTSGGLFLDGCVLRGAVTVQGSSISGRLSLRYACILGEPPASLGGEEFGSLEAESLICDASVDLSNLRTTCPVNLNLARILGALRVDTQQLAISSSPCVSLTLRSASVSSLHIDLAGIQESRSRRQSLRLIDLDLCTYNNRPNDDRKDRDRWLAVLRWGTVGYQARAYQQFATAQKTTGHDFDAGAVYIQQNEHRRHELTRKVRQSGRASWSPASKLTSAGMLLYRFTLGYGHRPLRAVASLLGLIGAALALVYLTSTLQSEHDRILGRPASTANADNACSSVELFSVALRISLPLVNNLGQGACVVNTQPWGAGIFTSIAFFTQVCAWILGALVLASVARSLRRSS